MVGDSEWEHSPAIRGGEMQRKCKVEQSEKPDMSTPLFRSLESHQLREFQRRSILPDVVYAR